MRGHLPSMRVWVDLGTDSRIEHLLRRHAQSEHQRAIAIVGKKPMVTGLHSEGRRGQYGFMTGTRYLEEYLVLTFELDLFVIDPTRHVHRPVNTDKRFLVESVKLIYLPGPIVSGFGRLFGSHALAGLLDFCVQIETIGFGCPSFFGYDNLPVIPGSITGISFRCSRHFIIPLDMIFCSTTNPLR